MMRHSPVLLLLIIVACKAPPQPSSGESPPALSFSAADADRWRALLIQSSTDPLPAAMRGQLKPHLELFLRRLTDAQVIEMAMAAQDAKLGAFLGSVASTNIERSWAMVMEHSDRGDQTAATQEAQVLLRLLGEEEVVRLTGSGSADGGDAAAAAESPTPAPRPATPRETPVDPVARGRELHARVLARYPRVDAFYRKPFLWGSMTDSPLATISVPASDWASFSAEERTVLEAYAASLVDQVRSSPLEYANVSPSAPAAATIRKRALMMDATSWGVMIGSLTPDGRDIQADSLVARGR